MTPKQKRFLSAFRKLKTRLRGISPTLAELAEELDVTEATIQAYVRRLKHYGVLTQIGRYRCLQITEKYERSSGRTK